MFCLGWHHDRNELLFIEFENANVEGMEGEKNTTPSHNERRKMLYMLSPPRRVMKALPEWACH